MRIRPAAALVAMFVLGACRGGFESAPVDGGIEQPTDATDAAVEDNGVCGSKVVQELRADGSGEGSTRADNNDFSSSCGGAQASDSAFLYQLEGDSVGAFITLETANFEGVVSLRTMCTSEVTELACATKSSDEGTRLILRDLDPGSYVILVDGNELESGAFALQATALLGTGASCTLNDPARHCDANLECAGAGTCMPSECLSANVQVGDFTASGESGEGTAIHAGSCGGFGGFRAPEAIFTIRLAEPVANLQATTDLPGTGYDTLIYLRRSCVGEELACNDDIDSDNKSSIIDSGPLEAGDYQLFIDGFGSDRGPFEVSVKLTPPLR